MYKTLNKAVINYQLSLAMPSNSNSKQEEFLQLLVAHERRLEGFILAMVADWTIAEDIAQETKLRLWEQFDKYDPRQDFGAWARSIAYYQVLSYLKKRKRSHERLFSDQFLQNIAEEEASHQEEVLSLHRYLADCFKKLTKKNRRLLALIYSSKESIRQIALQQGRSEAAVYKAVQYARDLLRRCIEEERRKEQAQ